VGLKFDVARACLNEAVRRMRAGIDLTKGRHADLLGNVECGLRPVHVRWVNHLMNWANWYYEGLNYPVLRVLYPDLENRFPADTGFDKRFAQPMMQSESPNTEFDQDFWNSVEKSGKFADWKFPDPPHTGVYLSKFVQSGSEPVTYVSHDVDDGAWQFLGDSMTESGGVLSCLHHPIDSDPSLMELADLPLGWYAEREAPGLPWHRLKQESEENGD
jgi:hypothetical protein